MILIHFFQIDLVVNSRAVIFALRLRKRGREQERRGGKRSEKNQKRYLEDREEKH
jgi:hypothetical protein